MDTFLNIVVFVAVVFVTAFSLCCMSAYQVLDFYASAEREALAKEEQTYDDINIRAALWRYFDSTRSNAMDARRQSIVIQAALQLSIGTTILGAVLYVTLGHP